jgi:hypothetical protein
MGIYPRGERDREEIFLVSVRGDPADNFFLSQGRGWGAKNPIENSPLPSKKHT